MIIELPGPGALLNVVYYDLGTGTTTLRGMYNSNDSYFLVRNNGTEWGKYQFYLDWMLN